MPKYPPRVRFLIQGAALGLAVVAAGPLSAEEPGEPRPAAQQPPDLERLLRLPNDLDYDVERRGGATRGEWRTRFREGRQELSQARASLERSQRELEGVAVESEAWLLAPPGVTDSSEAPLSYRLHQEIKRHRAEVERAQTRLRELEIEAELAGVPKDWREEPSAPAPAAPPAREPSAPAVPAPQAPAP